MTTFRGMAEGVQEMVWCTAEQLDGLGDATEEERDSILDELAELFVGKAAELGYNLDPEAATIAGLDEDETEAALERIEQEFDKAVWEMVDDEQD